jgi:exopolysaccharide production protein ExoY
MHTTKHDRVLTNGRASVGSQLFSAESSLSERELIMMASDLSAPSQSRGRWLDRTLDITVASWILLLLLPVMVLAAVAVALTSPGPVIFKQTRIGMNGREFDCYKFRSMWIDAEKRLASLLEEREKLRHEWNCNQKLRSDPRITPIGKILRHSSIDELPQLLNVIRGDMSLVGPRPIVRSELPKYGRYITTYFSVKPGLTGIWQVTGRNDLSYRRRVAADVWYARSKSLWLDLKILMLTVPAVITGRGSC